MDAAVEAFVDGDYAEAGQRFEAAVNEAESFGADDPRLAESLNGLGVVYRTVRRFTEAEPLLRRALAIRERVKDPAQLDLIQSRNNLAGLYLDQGRTADAEPLLKRSQALEVRTTKSEALPEVYRQGQAFYEAGRYEQAIPFWRKALELGEQQFGPDHPTTADLLDNLARLYYGQGRYAAAEPLFKRALAVREKAVGPDHHYVATSLSNLALLYQAQGHYAAAEPLYKRSLAIAEKALGPEHPNVAAILDNLSVLYRAQSKYAEAEPLNERALVIYEKALGPEHPDVAMSLNNLALLYDMRAIVDRKGLDRQAASTSQMGRFETEWLATDVNLPALTELSGVWIDRVHDRKTPKIIILDMDSSGCWYASFMAVAARQVTLMTDFVKRTKLSGIYCGTSLQTERWREI